LENIFLPSSCVALLRMSAHSRVGYGVKGGKVVRAEDLPTVETCDLVQELSLRDGVETHRVGPSASIKVKADGPCVVFVVVD